MQALLDLMTVLLRCTLAFIGSRNEQAIVELALRGARGLPMGSHPLARPRPWKLAGGRLIGIVEPAVLAMREASLGLTRRTVQMTLTGYTASSRPTGSRFSTTTARCGLSACPPFRSHA